MHLLIFQPKDMLNLYLHFNESHPIYAYKGMLTKTESTSFSTKSYLFNFQSC